MKTRITELFGIKHPIILAPMSYVALPPLVAAVSAAGGLGLLGTASMGPEEIRLNIAKARQLTDKPFGASVTAWSPNIDEQLDALIKEGVPILHVSGGDPRKVIEQVKRPGLTIIASVGTARHAERVAGYGADVVFCVGNEGGGHVGFVTSMVLIPAVANAAKLPVAAAGGFCDANGLVAALALGADAVVLGTRLALTKESPIPNSVKQRYLASTEYDTVITGGVTGHNVRALRNKLVDFLEGKKQGVSLSKAFHDVLETKRELKVPVWKLLLGGVTLMRGERIPLGQLGNVIAGRARVKKGMVEGDQDWGLLPCGQVSGRINDIPSCQQVIEGMVHDSESVLRKLMSQVGIGVERQ